MLLPMLMQEDCTENDTECEKKQKNMMVMMMSMQSQAPNTQMGPNMMLPMLLMDDNSSNENLMFYMMMSQGKPDCQVVANPVEVFKPVEVAQPVETVFRTWRVNADGTKTLISEE